MTVLSTPLLLAGLILLLVAAFVGIGLLQALYHLVLGRWQRRVKLPDPSGYCAFSVASGEPLQLQLHSTAPLTLDLFRLGAAPTPVGEPQSLAACPQVDRYDYRRGFTWPVTATIPTNDLTPGYHYVRVAHQGRPEKTFHIPFIVRKAKARVAVVASTNTWQTYNNFADLSNYRLKAMPLPMRLVVAALAHGHLIVRVSDRWILSAIPIPWRRPMINLDVDIANIPAGLQGRISTFVRGEWRLARHLDQLGIDYTVMSDHDFARSADRLAGADTIIFSTHSEYWSDEMIGRLAERIEQGAKVAFLSGNNIYRKVTFTADGHHVVDQAIDAALVASLIGTSYDPIGYHTYGAFRLLEPSHWLFAGLDVKAGSVFGAAPEHDPEWRDGLPRVIASGASGYETDKLRATSGGYTTLAIGTNAEGPAYMVYRDTPAGGWVFNCSSVSFNSLIGQDPIVDAIVTRLVADGQERTPVPDAT